jgi:hypothetical protein
MASKKLLSLREMSEEIGVNYNTLISCKKNFEYFLFVKNIGRTPRYPAVYIDFFRLVFALKDEGFVMPQISRIIWENDVEGLQDLLAQWVTSWHREIVNERMNERINEPITQRMNDRINDPTNDSINELTNERMNEILQREISHLNPTTILIQIKLALIPSFSYTVKQNRRHRRGLCCQNAGKMKLLRFPSSKLTPVTSRA